MEVNMGIISVEDEIVVQEISPDKQPVILQNFILTGIPGLPGGPGRP